MDWLGSHPSKGSMGRSTVLVKRGELRVNGPLRLGATGWSPVGTMTGGDTVTVAGHTFEVFHCPGHSPGSVVLVNRPQRFALVGDVLFQGSVGRTDLPGGDWGTLQASIGSLLDAYPPDTVVHPGHGPETTLATELAGNVFLAELREARAQS